MGLEAGTRLGTFEVLSPLGAGGMGEVYRARDTELGREVALKLLPANLANDPQRLARMKREARTLAALNHPGIATLHEVGDAEGTLFLVMELVEGPTLAERLHRGALPLGEALGLARQVAAALQAAHEKAIIHRDLKPANVKLTKEGQVKLLDFGLAKIAVGGEVDNEGVTATREGTATGVVLGTAAYMSPEQARGQDVDRRTDVWSFGCVLYEMLTGHRAFRANTVSDTLARVLEHEPDWNALPETTPALVRALLRQCLRKDPAKRLHDIADAGIELEEVLGEAADSAGTATPRTRRSRWHWIGYGLAAGLVAVALVAGWGLWSTTPPTQQAAHIPKRLTITLPPDASLGTTGNTPYVAISPDGTNLVYQAQVEDVGTLYLRPMGQLQATRIAGTDSAFNPFFSPDGRWLGFAGFPGTLRKVSIDGGAPATICDPNGAIAASWGSDGTIVFKPEGDGGLWRVPAQGGTPVELTRWDRDKEGSHLWPDVLPGGKAALFTIVAFSARQDESRIALVSLETGERRVLIEGGSFGRYVETEHIVYARNESLLAVPFDLGRLR
jgi:serine/threonine-protein kinase